MRKPEVSTVAWAGLIAGVAAYDMLAPDTQMLSERVDRGLERHPLVTTLAIGATALHLLNVLPEKIDPIHQVAEFARGLRIR